MGNCHYTYLTSEAVTEGHPDKICDQISDAIVDAYLTQDPASHVAVEAFVSGNVLTLAGEVASAATVDVTGPSPESHCRYRLYRPVSGFYGRFVPGLYQHPSTIDGYTARRDSGRRG